MSGVPDPTMNIHILHCLHLDDLRSIGSFSLRSSRPVTLSLSQSKAALAWIILIQDFQLPGPIVANSQLVNQIEKLKRADLNWKRRRNLKPCYKIRLEILLKFVFYSQAWGRVPPRRGEKQQAQDEIEIWSEPDHLQLEPVLRLQPSLPSRSESENNSSSNGFIIIVITPLSPASCLQCS